MAAWARAGRPFASPGRAPLLSNDLAVRRVLEAAGVEFIVENDGVQACASGSAHVPDFQNEPNFLSQKQGYLVPWRLIGERVAVPRPARCASAMACARLQSTSNRRVAVCGSSIPPTSTVLPVAMAPSAERRPRQPRRRRPLVEYEAAMGGASDGARKEGSRSTDRSARRHARPTSPQRQSGRHAGHFAIGFATVASTVDEQPGYRLSVRFFEVLI